ncbi:unnamed protein product, partial [Closterium sp. Naga37s-1]
KGEGDESAAQTGSEGAAGAEGEKKAADGVDGLNAVSEASAVEKMEVEEETEEVREGAEGVREGADGVRSGKSSLTREERGAQGALGRVASMVAQLPTLSTCAHHHLCSRHLLCLCCPVTLAPISFVNPLCFMHHPMPMRLSPCPSHMSLHAFLHPFLPVAPPQSHSGGACPLPFRHPIAPAAAAASILSSTPSIPLPLRMPLSVPPLPSLIVAAPALCPSAMLTHFHDSTPLCPTLPSPFPCLSPAPLQSHSGGACPLPLCLP